MKFSVITLFPNVFETVLNTSILNRAQQKGLVEFTIVDLRNYGEGLHQTVDDRPFGGGAGMILKADILAKALKDVAQIRPKQGKNDQDPYIILTSASGEVYNQPKANFLCQEKNHIILICGHYEGVDQRFIDLYVDEELSIGDYVLTGGELPALVIIDSITRLIKGVLTKEDASKMESFSLHLGSDKNQKLLEYPHYTRPAEFEGMKVPEVLQSGNHKEIEKWRYQQAIQKTKKRRPDLLKS